MPTYTPIVGTGAFDASAAASINSNFQNIQSYDLWVRPQNVSGNGQTGTYTQPFQSFGAAGGALRAGMTIGFQGVTKENWAPPVINDITIAGVANQPRQATDDGVANGGGATWLNPSTVASPLVDLAGNTSNAPSQAWRFQNVFFNNAGDAACVRLQRLITGSDSSHASFYGCWFTGADSGIQTGEIINLTVDGCLFFDFVGTGDTGIEASIAGGIANPPYLQWVITNNRFVNNVNHVVGALRNATISGNNFVIVGRTITTTIALSLASGAGNSVFNNMFNRPLNTSPNATLYAGGTGDVWSNNYGSDNIFFGVPDNS
jgi:hypothetical protein